MMIRNCLLFAAVACAAFGQSPDLCVPPPGGNAPSLPAKLMEGQGSIDFPITTSSAKAQAFFNQGVAQMHSFWATEAERSFLQAAAADPTAPMPQWGIAMVAAGDYRPRFQIEPLTKKSRETFYGGASGRSMDAAKKALELAGVPDKATEMEKLYIASVAARRDANAKDPDAAYIAGLRAILAKDPTQVEAKSYLALHLMRGFTLPDKKPREGTEEAVKLLRELLVEAPNHVGVNHYVIHGFEGSTFAKDAWTSCRRYPQVAYNIPHALHMPGHIWAQTGKWEEAADSFEKAARNELGYIRADQLYGTGHHGHNVHFLVTTYTFEERYDKAVEAAQGLLAFGENPREKSQVDNFRTAYRQGWFAMLRTLVHFEKWDELLSDKLLPEHDKPRETAWRHWALGLAQAARMNVEGAKAEAKAMDAAMDDFKARTKEDVPEPLLIARLELGGHIALASGKSDGALKTLELAGRKERALRYNEPPSYPRPVYQALGDIALAKGRRDVAEHAYREALSQYPESVRAKKGLSRATGEESTGGGR